MPTIAISNFPKELNTKKLLREFRKRGVEDVDFVDTDTAIRRLSAGGFEGVNRLYMFIDMCSHSEFYKIRSLLGDELPAYALTRKAASWPAEYFPKREVEKETEMPGTSVAKENTDQFFRDYIALREENASPIRAIQALSKYWTNGIKLTNIRQVNNFIYRQTISKAAPEFYLTWKRDFDSRILPNRVTTPVEDLPVEPVKTEDVAAEQSIQELVKTGVSVEFHIEKTAATDSGSTEWVRLLEEDNERLRQEAKSMKIQLAEAASKKAEAKTEPKLSLAKLFETLSACIQIGIMDEEAVVQKIKQVLVQRG